jgi:Apea-like HEPN
MHEESKILLKKALLDCLPVLKDFSSVFLTEHLVYKKTDESSWYGQTISFPDVRQVFAAANDKIESIGKTFALSFQTNHPEHKSMVGFPGFVWQNLGDDPIYLFRSALGHLWQQHDSFELSEAKIDTLVNEFETFFDESEVRFVFRSQLLNFQSAVDSITLPDDLQIRRLSEKEVSAIYGGEIGLIGMMRSRSIGIHEFCIEGEIKIPKVMGEPKDTGQSFSEIAKTKLEKATLWLRTFKEGRIGYDSIHYYPITFCPIHLGSHRSIDTFVPFGNYTLSTEEIDPLIEHAKKIIGISDAGMTMACSRLADAENRTRQEDRIVDAVIGMEALLLANLSKEDRRGELNFRFKLNYAMLFPSDQRQEAFKLANYLYNLRSIIAHGSSITEKDLKLAEKTMTLHEAGQKATDVLRGIIMHFLQKEDSPYKNQEFWQRAYLGLPSSD